MTKKWFTIELELNVDEQAVTGDIAEELRRNLTLPMMDKPNGLGVYSSEVQNIHSISKVSEYLN